MPTVNPKVFAATTAAALTTLVSFGASSLGVELPAEVQGAVTTVLVFAAGFLKTA